MNPYPGFSTKRTKTGKAYFLPPRRQEHQENRGTARRKENAENAFQPAPDSGAGLLIFFAPLRFKKNLGVLGVLAAGCRFQGMGKEIGGNICRGRQEGERSAGEGVAEGVAGHDAG
jgi:hypothetical protein